MTHPAADDPQSSLPRSVDALVTDQVLRTRIEQLVEQPGLPWLRHPLVSLVLGFILSGVIGTYLVNGIQQRLEEAKRKEEIREARRAAATKTFESVSMLLNHGSDLYSRASFALVLQRVSIEPDESFRQVYGKDLQRIRAEAERYVRLIDDFQSQLDGREIVDNANVCMSFGESIQKKHARVAMDFGTSHLHLKNIVLDWQQKRLTQSDTKHIQFTVFALKERIHALAVDMANALATDALQPADDASRAGTGYLGTARCKAIPEFTKPRTERR